MDIDTLFERRSGKRSKKEEQYIAQEMSKFHFVHKIEGWQFSPTYHASTQAHDRRPDLTRDQWKKMHKRVFQKIENLQPKNGEFIFFSKKIQQAYVAAVNFAKDRVRVITVLPKHKSSPKPGTIRFIVEGQEHDVDFDIPIIDID